MPSLNQRRRKIRRPAREITIVGAATSELRSNWRPSRSTLFGRSHFPKPRTRSRWYNNQRAGEKRKRTPNESIALPEIKDDSPSFYLYCIFAVSEKRKMGEGRILIRFFLSDRRTMVCAIMTLRHYVHIYVLLPH